MIDLDVTIARRAPGRYSGRVDLVLDALTGYDDDLLGAAAEGETPGAAIEEATAKVIALVRGNPELAAALLPLAGPQLATVLIAARYLDAPDILREFGGGVKREVKRTARVLRKAARKAKRVGLGIARVGHSIGKSLGLW